MTFNLFPSYSYLRNYCAGGVSASAYPAETKSKRLHMPTKSLNSMQRQIYISEFIEFVINNNYQLV